MKNAPFSNKFQLKFYCSRVGRKYASYCNKLENIFDNKKDKKICGCSLVKYVPSLYRESKGATGSESTHYYFLNQIFNGADFNEKHNFIDIGCGKGRVLAFLTLKNANWNINGIELNHDVASFAKNWTDKYDNITIIEGDAFECDYSKYDILSLGRPFETQAFIKFVSKIENEITHPIMLYYWWDSQSGDYLNNRPGWTLQTRGWFFKRGLIPAYKYPQRFSVWKFEPVFND